MNQASTLIRRNELPRAIANRMKSTPRTRRNEAEAMLKDIAFMLAVTRRVHDEILKDHSRDA